MPPNENAMQQAWRFRLWGTGRLRTVQGAIVRIVEAGKLNTGPGPDFRDAKIEEDGQIWTGSIEIHRRASDWYRHGHDEDQAYDNVILHVVGEDDCKIQRKDGTEVAQVVMGIDNGFVNLFNGLLNNPSYVLPMCGNVLDTVADIFKTDWITALAFERIARKTNDILTRLNSESGNWFQTVFVTLARGLGFGTNADNMERVARSIPFKFLLRHTDNLEAVEAILFGQAGLLDEKNPRDEYEANLAREYRFYAQKYGLTAIEKPIWHLSVRNQSNTPYRRLAILAKIVCEHGTEIGSRLCEQAEIGYVRKFFNVKLSEYWTYSFSFGYTSANRMSSLGKQSQDLLIINVLAPLVYARGLEAGNAELLDAATALWEGVEGEKNGIIRGFEGFGIEARTAFESQALIQLHKEYCERRRCPECRIGHRLLSSYITFK